MGRDLKGHRRKDATRGLTSGENPEPQFILRRIGIRRKPRERSTPKTLTENQQVILVLLDPQPTRQADLARQSGLSSGSVGAALYGLQDHGLVERIPFQGWKLT